MNVIDMDFLTFEIKMMVLWKFCRKFYHLIAFRRILDMKSDFNTRELICSKSFPYSRCNSAAICNRNNMNIQKYLKLKYYQYELTLALYMLEPWEKVVFSKV